MSCGTELPTNHLMTKYLQYTITYRKVNILKVLNKALRPDTNIITEITKLNCTIQFEKNGNCKL